MLEIDWGNPGFIRLYGLVFALAVVFTMVQWLISVVKRVVRGVPIPQAAMENVGYLLMSVAVAAFMPLAVAYTVDFIDSAAEKIFDEYFAELFSGGVVLFAALTALATVLLPGVGIIIAIPILLMILMAVFGLWIILVVRNALILLGLIFGPLVFAGLVDKDLWGHTRKWVGIMGGIIASKLGIYLALALAGALVGNIADDVTRIGVSQAIGTCLTFTALLFIALFMPFQVAKWLPFVGDEIQAMAQVKEDTSQRAKAVKAGGDEMKARAAAKKSADSGGGAEDVGGAMSTTGKAAPPAAAATGAKEVGDQVRDQTVQAAKDGANSASGGGGGEGQEGGGSSRGGKSPSTPGGSPLGGGRGGSGTDGGGAARRPAPAPPPRSSAPGSGRRGAPPPSPPSRQGGGAPAPPSPPSRQGGGAPPPPPPASAPPPPAD